MVEDRSDVVPDGVGPGQELDRGIRRGGHGRGARGPRYRGLLLGAQRAERRLLIHWRRGAHGADVHRAGLQVLVADMSRDPWRHAGRGRRLNRRRQRRGDRRRTHDDKAKKSSL